ncbi:MAG: Fic family protein [Candidatus Omnitrophica bacterium]|nr:Fic family protein [Candidatus Omnitrophota bacterium]
MDYQPHYRTTASMIRCLGKIEASREIVENLDIPLDLEREFRRDASAKMSHYSTKIEGNRLTLKQTKELLAGKEVFARDIDKREVINYYDCLEFIQQICKTRRPLTEKLIKEIHSIIQKGILKGKLRGEYREAQNAIYDSRTRKPVYFPPEAKDVPRLMKSFVNWFNHDHETHPILKAGVAHYQFVTVHPFMDGNGRTARALATLALYREKYDLKRFYSLEEYYDEDLLGYYDSLHQCQGVHYYHNPNPDITLWLEYFLKGAAVVFEEVKEKTLVAAKKHLPSKSKKDIELLQKIGPREKRVLAYFQKNLQLRTQKLCALFHIKERAARDLLAKWIGQGMIEKQGSGKRDSYYVLSADFRRLIGS